MARALSRLGRLTGYRLERVPSVAPEPAPERQPKPKPKPKPEKLDRGSVRPPADPENDRLLTAPVFVICSVRSGSTLLRVLLNSHPEICAPHETHFQKLRVSSTWLPAVKSLGVNGLNLHDAEHLLWDRLLHRELTRSGKSIMVEKTPLNALNVDRLAAAWPDARFIFLLRHPLLTAQSWQALHPDTMETLDDAIEHTLRYMRGVEDARLRYPGLTLTYEDLTTDPERETRRVCEFLGVEWDPAMLEYGEGEHGPFRAGLGDRNDKIKSGRVQASRPLPSPEEVPDALHEIAQAWGYLPTPDPVDDLEAGALKQGETD